MLVEYLRTRDVKVELMREPGGTDISERVRDILHDLRARESSAKKFARCWKAARWLSATVTRIRHWRIKVMGAGWI